MKKILALVLTLCMVFSLACIGGTAAFADGQTIYVLGPTPDHGWTAQAGAYAQALWLLDHGFKAKPTQQESELISEHNLPYLIPDDVDEALRTFVRMPSDTDNPEAYTAGDLLNVLYTKGFRGPKYTSQAIAKAMKGMGFDTIRRQGRNKYVVVIADAGRQQCERKKDVDDVEPF